MNVPFVNRVSCCYLAFLFAVLSARAGTENSTRVAVGEIPARWFAGQTGAGEARWKVVENVTAPSPSHVLEQSGVAKFPICVQTNTAIRDGFVAVKFKPISGKEDQAGGVIWRFQDPDNYYVARANALEDNLTIYRTVNGKRTEFKRVDRPVRCGEWHDIRVDYQGQPFPGDSGRNGRVRGRRCHLSNGGCGGCLDEGGQRDVVRRF